MKKVILFLTLISLVYGEVTIEKVDFSKAILQVGAFKNDKVLSKFKIKLKNYNLLTKDVNGYKKLFVINPTTDQIKNIKKIVPKAFLLSSFSKNKIFKTKTSQKSNIPTIKLNLKKNNTGLNTKTIIETRKKFFK